MSGEFGTGKTVFVLAVVVGCFAVLWPKIFYPMLTASVKPASSSRQASAGWEEENSYFLSQLCFLVEQQQQVASTVGTRSDFDCIDVVYNLCQVQISESVIEDYRQEQDSTNLTACLASRFSLSRAVVAAAAPPRVRSKPYESKHVRPERPAHLYPEMMHPALREKGRALPQRTIEKQARPGPMPGVRPPLGGAGGMIPPSQGNKGSGAMGIIMPLYTVGIIIFFVYTIMKVLFKKGNDDTTPKLKDFHLDPEYRKYVFAEEYMDKSNANYRQHVRRRDDSRGSRKRFHEPDTKIGSSSATERMDTGGKELGEWYLPEGFVKEKVSSDEEEDEFTIGGTTVEEAAKETVRDRIFDGGGFLPKMMSEEDEKKKKKRHKKRPYKRPFRYRDITCDEDITQYAKEIEEEEEKILQKMEKDEQRQQEARGRLRKQDLEIRGRTGDAEGHKEPVIDPSVLYSDEFLDYLRSGLRKFERLDDVNQESFIEACRLARDLMETRNPGDERDLEDAISEEEEDKEKEEEEEEEEEDEDKEGNEESQGSVSLKQDDDWSGENVSAATASDELSLDHLDTEEEDGEALPSSTGFSLIEDSPTGDDQGDAAPGKSECDKKDEQMTQLRRRLEETEKAMERLMDQMGTVTDKLTAAKITEVLTQAQAQAKILKTEEESKTSSKGSSPDMDDYEVINKEDDETKLSKKELATSDADATQGQAEIEEASCGALPARDADESLQEEDTAATAGHDDGDDHHDHHDEEETKTNAQGEQGSEEGVTPLQDAASSSGTGSTVQEIPPTERWTGLDSSREDEAVTTTAPPAEASSAEASHVAATEEIHAGEADPTSTLRSSRSADDDVGDSLAKDQAEEQ